MPSASQQVLTAAGSLPKVRNLAQWGVITDPDPFTLPPTAFSMAVNARFRNGRVVRSPVLRKIAPLREAHPRFLSRIINEVLPPFGGGVDSAYVCYRSGDVTQWGSPENPVLINPAGYTPSDIEASWSDCFLADLLYINRADRLPWYVPTGGSLATFLPNTVVTLNCQVLRAYNDALVMLNVSKNGAPFVPNMVKTSSFATAGNPPASWDATNPATNATETILSEMVGPIVDGARLGQSLIIYGFTEAWQMVADGSFNIYSYTRLPFSKGALNTNCSVLINNRHYVFGPTDIWMHDGITERSIADGRVREFIYRHLDPSRYYRCFVVHNERYSELLFCFPSFDPYCAFPSLNGLIGNDGCNRAATYNYVEDKWTFDDLPFVYYGQSFDTTNQNELLWSGGGAPVNNIAGPWSTIGGTWNDTQGVSAAPFLSGYTSQKRTLHFVNEAYSPSGLTAASMYAFDPPAPDSSMPYPVDLKATQGMYLERDGLDLDELAIDLQGYKQFNYLVPIGRIDPASTATINFSVGAADDFNETPVFSPNIGYDGVNFYKVDIGMSGRYLFLKIRYSDYRYVSLSGYDVSVQVTGER